MIFCLLIIHNHDRTSSVTRVLHTATWNYFISDLPKCFSRFPQVVKDAIMTDINNLVQEFRGTSSDIGASLFVMRRLLGILQMCFYVCFDINSIFATANDFTDKYLHCGQKHGEGVKITGTLPSSRAFSTESKPNAASEEPILRYSWMGIERCFIS